MKFVDPLLDVLAEVELLDLKRRSRTLADGAGALDKAQDAVA